VLLAGVAPPTPSASELASALSWRGEMRLQRGELRIAIDLFNDALGADPSSGRARAGLAIAYAGLTRCAEALPLLTELRAGSAWSARTALAEGDCLARRGAATAAIASYEESLALDPDSAETLRKLALALHAAGQSRDAEDALDALLLTDGPSDVVTSRLLAEVWMAYDGPADDAWTALALLRRRIERASLDKSPLAAEADTIEGLLWLDAGDPEAAAAALVEAGLRSRVWVRITSLRAEALRRMGRVDEARLVLADPKAAKGDLPIRSAVLARLAIDEGDRDAAHTILVEAGPSEHADLLASWWYLARAERRSVEMAEIAARWGRANRSPERRLEQLLPWGTP